MRDRQEVIDISREDRDQQFNKSFGKVQAQVIPPNPDLLINISDRQEIVGPYCRVSTMSGEQVESFEMQRIYYKNLFAKRPNWTLHDIYADEGLSATSTKRRKDFQRLVYDCENHILTLVLAKSVTRFARNVVDCVSTCRRLKHLTPPVGVLFETENIHTLTQSSEVPLNMFALLAQSESETKSASVKWGIYRPGTQIRSKMDALLFCQKVLQPGTWDCQDANDPKIYHRFHKDSSGIVALGSAQYGSDPITAPIPMLESENLVDRVYAIRKSINRHLSSS